MVVAINVQYWSLVSPYCDVEVAWPWAEKSPDDHHPLALAEFSVLAVAHAHNTTGQPTD